MALNFTGVRFQPFKDVEFLSNMNIAQLKSYLATEQEDLAALEAHLTSLKEQATSQLQSFNIQSIKFESENFDNESEKANLINQIKETRMKKMALMAAKKQMEIVLKASKKAESIINYDKVISILKNLGADDEEIEKAMGEIRGDEEYDEIREWHEDYQANEFMKTMEEQGNELIDLSEAESYFTGAE